MTRIYLRSIHLEMARSFRLLASLTRERGNEHMRADRLADLFQEVSEVHTVEVEMLNREIKDSVGFEFPPEQGFGAPSQ